MPQIKSRYQKGIEVYKHPKTSAVLGIVVRNSFRGQKYNFITPDNYALQLGLNSYAAGEEIIPHFHARRIRKITSAQECIIIKKGRVIFYMFDASKKLIAQTTLKSGDVAFYVSGGHGFKVCKDARFIEVKQGPFFGEKDKIRFEYRKTS